MKRRDQKTVIAQLLKRTAAASAALLVLLGTGVSGTAVLADTGETLIGPTDSIERGEDADAYRYTVHVYAGKEGYFTSTGTAEKQVTVNAGESASIDIADLVVYDKDQYYPRGMKIAGHDNDEVSTRDYQSYTWNKLDQDYSFSVAYGIKGGMVEYYVDYIEVDANGNKVRDLLGRQKFYGMVDDKPVVSYQYVPDYRPNAWNQGKTLIDPEEHPEIQDPNVITFTYTRLTQPAAPDSGTASTTTTTTTTTAGTTGTGTTGTGTAGTGTAQAGTTGTGTNGTAQTGTAGSQGATGTAPAATGTGTAPETEGTTGQGGTAPAEVNPGVSGSTGQAPEGVGVPADNGASASVGEAAPAASVPAPEEEPPEYIDLDEEQVPLAGVDNSNQSVDGTDESAEEAVERTRSSMKPVVWVIAGIAAAAVIGGVAYSSKRRSDPDDEDDLDL